MPEATGLVGREREREVIRHAIAGLVDGAGGMLLVSGEAGVGKTALVDAVLSSADVWTLRGAAHAGATLPYGPLAAALRDHLHRVPGKRAEELVAAGPTLALVLPELGPLPPDAATANVPLAIRTAFENIAARRPTVVFLDDLQWADAATSMILQDWAASRAPLPLLLIVAYRSDELPHRHPLRGVRVELRRAAGPRHHLRVGPLTHSESARVVTRLLGEQAPADVVARIHRRANGVPFYLEELAASVADAGDHADGMTATAAVPESVRDAVLLRLGRVSEAARTAAELAAAAGSPVPLEVLGELAGHESAVEELLECGLLVEQPPGTRAADEVAFRHALLGEAVYAATPWFRRRRHHAALAAALQERGISAAVVAAHWSDAREPARARPLLVTAAEAACALHAYRDAKRHVEEALALWPAGEDDPARLLVLDRLSECAERCGEIHEAAAVAEEVAAAHRATGDHDRLARAERRLAAMYELNNDWPRALAARGIAAEAFERTGRLGEAASERMAGAVHLWEAGDLSGGLQEVRRASELIDAAARDPRARPVGEVAALGARAMALEGAIRASLGEGAAGAELTRRALDLSLRSDLEPLTAEIYYLRSIALEEATDYAAALDAMGEAVTICRRRGLEEDAHVCLACLTPALRHTGRWDRALEIGEEVLAEAGAPEVARMVAAGEVGLILANRGRGAPARRLLARSAAFSRVHELFPLEIETAWGLARIDDCDGDVRGAAARLRELTARCQAREERHYSVAALRWAATFFGRHGMRRELGAATDALARTAAIMGTSEATAALAHALGEAALLECDGRRAADQFERALELLRTVRVPPETAETQLRAGVALVGAGERDLAIERLVAAYHTARALGARPLAASAVRRLEELDEDVTRRLGRRASRAGDVTGLTPREREVLRLVARGLTNRDVAAALFLSTRTVDMHVRNLLAKLGCRTRTHAVRRAEELHLVAAVDA